LSGSRPAATLPQVPFAPLPFFAAEQAWQVPLHGASQHNPSTQNPLAHWFDAKQAPPVAVFARHCPPEQ
jgi:hypothetical protein